MQATASSDSFRPCRSAELMASFNSICTSLKIACSLWIPCARASTA